MDEIDGTGLDDKTAVKLSQSIQLKEVAAFNQVFPQRRISEVQVTLQDGRVLDSGPTEANGDPGIPLSDSELTLKYFSFAQPVLGETLCQSLFSKVRDMGGKQNLDEFNSLVFTSTK